MNHVCRTYMSVYAHLLLTKLSSFIEMTPHATENLGFTADNTDDIDRVSVCSGVA